jgi:hypothetical protein
MDWEKTVMSLDEIRTTSVPASYDREISIAQTIATKQAELSYKAGQQDRAKEIIEWLETHKVTIWWHEEEWQSQCKEWLEEK